MIDYWQSNSAERAECATAGEARQTELLTSAALPQSQIRLSALQVLTYIRRYIDWFGLLDCGERLRREKFGERNPAGEVEACPLNS